MSGRACCEVPFGQARRNALPPRDLAARTGPKAGDLSARSGIAHHVTSAATVAGLDPPPEGWDDLAARAVAPQPYFTRPVLSAHARNGITATPRVLCVQVDERLAGLLPFRRGARIGWFGRGNAAWTSAFTTSSTPLIASDDPARAVAGLLDGMARLASIWIFPQLTLDDEIGRALLAEIGRRGWPARGLDPFRRAVLDRRASHDAYLSELGTSRRRDLARRMRRLGELGTVEFRSETGSQRLADAVEAFLRLEAAGWKGRQGSALASRPETASFARDLFREGQGPLTRRADLLLVDGEPAAISLALVCSGTAYLWKTAYDERRRRLAPGLLLELEIVRAMHETGFADRLNSAADPDTPLSELYPDREEVADLVVCCDPGRIAPFDRLIGREEFVRSARRGAKALYRRVMASRALATRRRKT